MLRLGISRFEVDADRVSLTALNALGSAGGQARGASTIIAATEVLRGIAAESFAAGRQRLGRNLVAARRFALAAGQRKAVPVIDPIVDSLVDAHHLGLFRQFGE